VITPEPVVVLARSCFATRPFRAPSHGPAGRRGIGLPDPLIELLKQHRLQQAQERTIAADLWRESGYVFTTPTGEPLNPRTDDHPHHQ
jgi:hypothetical protein